MSKSDELRLTPRCTSYERNLSFENTLAGAAAQIRGSRAGMFRSRHLGYCSYFRACAVCFVRVERGAEVELLNTMRGANVEQLEVLRTDISPLHRRCRRRALHTKLQNCFEPPEDAVHKSSPDFRLESLVLSLTRLR